MAQMVKHLPAMWETRAGSLGWEDPLEKEMATHSSTLSWTERPGRLQSMGFSRQEHWSGLPFPSPGDLPDPGIEPRSPTLQADALPSEPPEKPLSEGGSENYICLVFKKYCDYLGMMRLSGGMQDLLVTACGI